MFQQFQFVWRRSQCANVLYGLIQDLQVKFGKGNCLEAPDVYASKKLEDILFLDMSVLALHTR